MKDLTKGYPAKVIMMFAFPLMFGFIFQQLYNMADSKIVSTYVGTDALAAVGATAVVSNMIISFINGLTQGFAIPIANSFGARDMGRLRRLVAGATILTFGVAVLLTVVGLVCIKPILDALNTPEDIMVDALAYVRIILAGIIFTALYNFCANVLRAVGDSKTPVYCLLVAVVANIGLDLLFVAVFHWGIEGAAIATVIAQAISGVLCGGYLLVKFKEILPGRKEWKLEMEQYTNLITTGVSMGLMGCIVNIGTVVLQGSINDLGTDIVAAHTAARRVFDILTVTLYTVGLAMTTFTSQNMGARKPERVRQGVRHSIFIVSAITTVLIVISYLFGEPILKWITNTDKTTIIDASVMYCHICIWFFYVLGPLFVLRCTLQGMGRKIIPVCSSVLEMVVKVLSASLLVPALQYVGVAFTEPISWIVMTILLGGAYLAKSPEKVLEEKQG
ncbi:MAG: MATE family efflux transporter [Lachnospiraceae bacterium]|nr:MATE family efflux transporter [Lachnospiraceae bacterium]